MYSYTELQMQWKAMSSAGISLFQRPLISAVFIGSWQLLATISTIVTLRRCLALWLTALCRLISHTSRPLLVLQYRRTVSVTSCSTGTLLDAF